MSGVLKTAVWASGFSTTAAGHAAADSSGLENGKCPHPVSVARLDNAAAITASGSSRGNRARKGEVPRSEGVVGSVAERLFPGRLASAEPQFLGFVGGVCHRGQPGSGV